jgi:hypothetical protein
MAGDGVYREKGTLVPPKVGPQNVHYMTMRPYPLFVAPLQWNLWHQVHVSIILPLELNVGPA